MCGRGRAGGGRPGRAPGAVRGWAGGAVRAVGGAEAEAGRSNLEENVRMKRFRFTMIAVALVSLAGRFLQAQTQPAITSADLRQRLYLIADDSMMGRETGSEGAFTASAYVAAEFGRLGLEP